MSAPMCTFVVLNGTKHEEKSTGSHSRLFLAPGEGQRTVLGAGV